MIEILSFAGMFSVIVILIVAILLLCRIIKRQEKTISDLLDRITAPDFNSYAIAREQAQRIEAKPTKEQKEYLEDTLPDGLRVE
jgi:hypothetical protein